MIMKHFLEFPKRPSTFQKVPAMIIANRMALPDSHFIITTKPERDTTMSLDHTNE